MHTIDDFNRRLNANRLNGDRISAVALPYFILIALQIIFILLIQRAHVSTPSI
jgi:hypothetical protein